MSWVPRCDQCGKVGDMGESTDWIELKSPDCDFCSWECVMQYARYMSGDESTPRPFSATD